MVCILVELFTVGTTTLKQKLIIALASGFGIGFIPKGSGTVATLATIPLCCALQHSAIPYIYPATLAVIFLIAVPLATQMERIYKQRDPHMTVLDEVIGYLITMIGLPTGWLPMLIGFVMFRFFDILKPPPINWIDEKVPRGWGVVLDDACAGLIANLCSRLLLHLIGEIRL